MPIATVAAIIKNEAGKILLTRRNVDPFKGQWCLPGGHIDDNEKAFDAVIREAKEETGLEFEPEFLFYTDEIIPELKWHAVVLVFAGKGTGELTVQEREVKEIAWFSLDKARSLPLAFVHNQILDEYVVQKWD
jgi:8-oxo-dGTP diphosphatase